MRSEKDDNALYHDAQLCHIVRNIRVRPNKSTSGWFLTDDNSVIAHGIYKKGQDEPPYSIKSGFFTFNSGRHIQNLGYRRN